jgi:hypothetical protein
MDVERHWHDRISVDLVVSGPARDECKMTCRQQEIECGPGKGMEVEWNLLFAKSEFEVNQSH